MKKITIVISSLTGGGAEKVCTTIANQLVQLGYAVNVMVLNLENSVYSTNLHPQVNLIDLKINHARYSFIAFYRHLRNSRPERVLVFNHELAVALLIVRIFLKEKFKIIARNINTLSESDRHELSFWHKYVKSIFTKYLYRYMDAVISQSEIMKIDLVQHLKVDPKRITVINNPVAEEFYNFKDDSTIQKKHEILFIGRLEKQKGLTYLLQAFKNIHLKDPLLILRILGEGSLKREAQVYVEKNNLQDHVFFEGFNKKAIKYFRRAKATILTSLFEGFPNVLIESISVGTPVVSFNCKSGPSEIIIEGVNGYLVNYLDIIDLEEKILRAVANQWNSQRIIETASRYSPAHIMKMYTDLLKNI